MLLILSLLLRLKKPVSLILSREWHVLQLPDCLGSHVLVTCFTMSVAFLCEGTLNRTWYSTCSLTSAGNRRQLAFLHLLAALREAGHSKVTLLTYVQPV